MNQPKHNISAPQQFTNEIRLVESNGPHWIDVDSQALERRGPFVDIETAEGMAIQFAAICGVFHKPMEIWRGRNR